MSVDSDDHAQSFITPSVSITKITFSGGDEVEVKPGDKVMIVGPNNSGKSRSLREMRETISSQTLPEGNVVVRGVSITKNGSLEDFINYLKHQGKLDRHNNYIVGDWQINAGMVHYWSQDNLSGGTAAGFMKNLDANARLGICTLQNSIAIDQPPTCPQHLLYEDDVLMKQVSSLFQRAFGKELLVDFRGGGSVPIHVGETPRGKGFEDRVSDAYTRSVRSQPYLHEQGDGMQSFAGILFHTIVSNRDITFIDEPEAFLHPPQMRRLGETLSTNVAHQLFVATHSSDILRGFLEGKKGAVRILRIRRDGSVNRIYEAAPASIATLWSTPVLRYSSALDAIFHDQAIICEDDSDCRLFNSVADHLQEAGRETWLDTAYVPMGGKAGIAKVARILRAVGVPVKAVYDFDLISVKSDFKNAVEAFGGDWESISIHWKRIFAAIDSGPHPTIEAVKEEIREILNLSKDDKIPKKEIDEAIRRKSPWARVKSDGINGLPRGDLRNYAAQMLQMLEHVGIYLVPGGETESFCPSIGGHGPAFVTRVLDEIPLDDDRLDELRKFTRRVHQGQAAPIEPTGTIAERNAKAESAEKAGKPQQLDGEDGK